MLATLVVLTLLQASPQPAASPADLALGTFIAVSDAKGEPITDLKPQEVTLYENGFERPLVQFAPDPRPLALTILLDSSEPVASSYRLQLVAAVKRFVRELPEGTTYSIWVTGERPQRIVDFTTEPAAAAKPLEGVFPRGGNSILDALVEAPAALRHQEAHRTAVVAVTGTGVGYSKGLRAEVVKAARPLAMLFEAVQFEAEGAGVASQEFGAVGRGDYAWVLTNLTKATGGRYEMTMGDMGVGKALDRVAADLGSQYLLGYLTVPGLAKRALRIHVGREGAEVHQRR
jgi:VWFA-related protein